MISSVRPAGGSLRLGELAGSAFSWRGRGEAFGDAAPPRRIAAFTRRGSCVAAKALREVASDDEHDKPSSVAGGAKRRFREANFHFDMSVPTMILGTPTGLPNPDGITSIACEFFATPDMPETFLIEVALKPEEKST